MASLKSAIRSVLNSAVDMADAFTRMENRAKENSQLTSMNTGLHIVKLMS